MRPRSACARRKFSARRWCPAVALAFAAACAEAPVPPPVAGAGTAADSADQVIEGMTTWLHDGGLQRARILADTAYFFHDNSRLEMHRVSAQFFTSTGAEEGQMNADRAVYDTRGQRMEAWGNVVVRNVTGRRLTSSQLRYDQTSNQIASDSAFTMTEPDRVVRGVGFVSDPAMTSLEIRRLISTSVGTVAVPGK